MKPKISTRDEFFMPSCVTQSRRQAAITNFTVCFIDASNERVFGRRMEKSVVGWHSQEQKNLAVPLHIAFIKALKVFEVQKLVNPAL